MTNDIIDLATQVGAALRAKGLLLSTAESCTGGGVAQAVTEIAGSSDWFDCGFVTYSNASKEALLDVPAALIAQFGAVSEEVAAAMAQGARANSQAGVALSTTGIAGPGGAVAGQAGRHRLLRLVDRGQDPHAAAGVRGRPPGGARTERAPFAAGPAAVHRVALRALLRCAAACLLAPAACAAPPVTVYAAGDIAHCAHPDAAWSGAAATAALVAAGLAAEPQAAVLVLGDLAYPRGTAAEFANCYGPTWGKFKHRTWPAPGNHEYGTAGAAPYFAYFGANAGRGYYSFQLGSWRLFSLNSNLKPADHAVQLAWLRDELARHPARCTLAYWHHPLYSSGMKGNDERMKDAWQLLYRSRRRAGAVRP